MNLNQTLDIVGRVALSLSGLSFRSQSKNANLAGNTRMQLPWVRSLGMRGVVLDATAPEMRPRMLDRSGRRDVASLLRHNDLSLAGLDLLIPPTHLVDPAFQDRAFSAIREALTLASDLAALADGTSPVVSVLAPPTLTAKDIEAIAQLTDSSSAMLALIAWPMTEELRVACASVPKLRSAFDPARVLAAGANAAKELSRSNPMPVSIRLSDFDGVARVPLGRGNLDLTQYVVAALVANAAAPIVLDLQGLTDSETAISAAVNALS